MKKEKKKKDTIKVSVFSPSSVKPKKFKWDRNLLVSDAAKEAAKEFELKSEKPGLEKNEEVLDPTLTLDQVGIKDKDELELIDTGGGV